MSIINNFKKIFARSGSMTSSEAIKNNPKFQKFANAQSQQDLDVVHSVVLGKNTKLDTGNGAGYTGNFSSFNEYKDFIYSPIPSNKISRINYYREMGKFPEISDALDEINDNCINLDENGKCLNLIYTKLGNNLLDDNQKDELQYQFERFIDLFEFDINGYEIFKDFLVEGEQCWENIVDNENPDAGIIGVTRLKPESYELLISPEFRMVGVLVNGMINQQLLLSFLNGTNDGGSNQQSIAQYSGVGRTLNVYNASMQNKQLIPLPISQITYINSGILNDTKTVVFPILDRARRAYNQLQMIEDAVIIWRLTRSTQRLVFKVDPGKVNASRAEQILQQTMKRYQTKRIYNPNTGGTETNYDPIQMSENYWFLKSADGGGTEVSTLEGSGSGFDKLPDLEYFLRKLYIALKIPFDRFKNSGEGQSTAQYDRYGSDAQISYEEYRFSKFIIKIQSQVAKGLVASFITHLKLTGLWDKFKMNSSYFRISFVPPTMYDIYMKQKMLNVKMENYKTYKGDGDEFSSIIAQREMLGWTPSMIDENNKMKKREVIEKALLDRIVETVKKTGKLYEQEGEIQEISGGMDQNPDMFGGPMGGAPGGGGMEDQMTSGPDIGENSMESPSPESSPEPAPTETQAPQ